MAKSNIKKDHLNTYLAFAALSMFGSQPQPNYEPKQKKVVNIEEQTIKRNERKGLKQFTYNEGIIWALNEKTADAKASKKNWTK